MYDSMNGLLGSTRQINILAAAALGASTKRKGYKPYENQYFKSKKVFHDFLLLLYNY